MKSGLELSRHTLGPFEQNCYLMVGPSGRRAAIVDPGLDSEPLLELLEDRGVELEWIVNTHGHLDHAAGNRFFKERTGARLIIHPGDSLFLSNLQRSGTRFGLELQDSPPADEHFVDGQPFRFDGLEFDVIHTPGHSPGGVCLRLDRTMFVGDTLFHGSIGRTDLPGGSQEQLIQSIRERLFPLPGDTVCYPGHGPETTLDRERRDNPFVSDQAVGTARVQ